MQQFEAQIAKAGGEGIAFRDIMGALWDELHFSEAKKAFSDFGDFILQEGISTYIAYQSIGKGFQAGSNRAYFNLIANLFGKKEDGLELPVNIRASFSPEKVYTPEEFIKKFRT